MVSILVGRCLRGLCKFSDGRDSSDRWIWALSLWWKGAKITKHPVCWWVWLCSHHVDCLTWGFPALEAKICWLGLMVASRRVHTNEYPQKYCCQCFCSPSELELTPVAARDLPLLACRSDTVSYGAIAFIFTWDLVPAGPCVLPPRLDSVFPSPVSFMWWNPADFQARFYGGFSSCCWTLRLGRLIWVSGLSMFSWLCPLLPSHCSFLFVFGWKVSFLSIIVQQVWFW